MMKKFAFINNSAFFSLVLITLFSKSSLLMLISVGAIILLSLKGFNNLKLELSPGNQDYWRAD